MEKQQVALEETLMGKGMTQGALEAGGGSSRPKQAGFQPVLALVAVMGLLIVVLVTAFIYCFLQCRMITSCDLSPEAAPARDPGTLMTNCTWKESDSEETHDIFTADYSAKYLVYGWVKFSEDTHQQLTLIQLEGGIKRTLKDAKVDQTMTIFFFEEINLIKNMKLSLFVSGKLKSCKDSRFHVYKL